MLGTITAINIDGRRVVATLEKLEKLGREEKCEQQGVSFINMCPSLEGGIRIIKT